MESFLEAKNRPSDWPANARENLLDNIYRALEKFNAEPGFHTKEALISLATSNDLNQRSYIGWYRVTEYEVQLINIIYVWGTACCLNAVKICIYEIIEDTARLQKSLAMCSAAFSEKEGSVIKAYDEFLLPPLKLFYLSYIKFNLEKSKPFAKQIVDTIYLFLENAVDDDVIEIVNAYISMLNDMGYMHGTKKEKVWEFTREQLKELFDLEVKLISKVGINPCVRPLKGVLMTQLSNYILKSRNNYNEDYICKYIPVEVAAQSVENCQIWMKKIDNLNDKREKHVLPELFKDASWIKFSWVHELNFTATRTYYVSSFSKNINNKDMNTEYGSCIYGFKNDRMVDLLSPIAIHKMKKQGENTALPDSIISPICAQVLAFDVLYDKNKAKEELNFLIEIIDHFNLSDAEKKSFLEHIMQYWILSIKDYKWHKERERRYVLFLYDDYNYVETELDDMYLKMKTSVFLLPDFILGDNPSKSVIRRQIDGARKALAEKDYLFCHNCLNRDYDAIISGRISKCPICGSGNIEIVKKEMCNYGQNKIRTSNERTYNDVVISFEVDGK